MDKTFDELEIIKDFKNFATEADAFFHDDIERIKSDRDFAGGGSAMWNENDESNRGQGRSQVSYSFLPNYLDAITNPFKSSPYSLTVTPKKQESLQLARLLQKKVKDIESTTNAKNAYHNALKDAVTAGIGYAYVTTEEDELSDDDTVNTMIYPILDATMIIPDFGSKEIDGSDSEQIAIIEHIKIAKAKSLFGDDIVGDLKYRPALVGNFGTTWRAPDSCLALVTYFKRKRTSITGQKKVKITVEFYKMIGDKIVANGELDCPYIPIVPFKGDELFRNGRKINVGIVDKAKPVQKNINYMVSLLRERIAKAPKPLFFAGKSAVEGQEEYYENIDKSFNPLIIFNDKDDKGMPIAAPVRIENSVQTQDLSSQIDANINYMSLIIGMPTQGITGTVGAQETAESVLMRSRSAESNQSHYYENAKASIKHIGRILMYMLKQTANDELGLFKVSDVDIDVSEGPELITTRIESRKDLIALSQILPESMKPLVAQKIAATMDNDGAQELSKELYVMLPPELKPNLAEDPAAKQIMADMSGQIDTLMTQQQESQRVIAQQQAVILELENDSKAAVYIQELKNKSTLENTIIKENAADSRLAKELLAEADKTVLKAQLDSSEAEHKYRAELLKATTPLFNNNKGITRM